MEEKITVEWGRAPGASRRLIETPAAHRLRRAQALAPRIPRRALPLLLGFFASVLCATSVSAQSALPFASSDFFFNLSSGFTHTIDLGTLPARPILVAEVIPDSSHPDLIAEIRFQNYQVHEGGGFLCQDLETTTDVSTPVPGTVELRKSLIPCDPIAANWVNDTVDVVVRVLDFGSGLSPATLNVRVYGETLVPFGERFVEFQPTFAPQTVSVLPSKDTSIYEKYPTLSNGGGDLIVVGNDTNPFTGQLEGAVHGLLAFDLVGPVPQTAQVDNAELFMTVDSLLNGGEEVELYTVSEDTVGMGLTWDEGTQDAAGNEWVPAGSDALDATWNERTFLAPWGTPGGDYGPTPLNVRDVFNTGLMSFASPALTSAVAGMVSTGDQEDGFLLRGNPNAFFDTAAMFRSRNASPTQQPAMVVTFTPTEPYQLLDGAGETLQTGVVSFIGEGENFRWIYDLDQDDVLTTDIGGVCTVLADQPNSLPYSYQFEGTPGYTGLDCCTWQIDSPQTETLGTGQAIFFHNLDPGNPANTPPDTDGDGIRDLCDNCVAVPNGPLLGTCVAGSLAGNVCRSDGECAGDVCSLSQEDGDGNFEGDVCVPEPAFGGLVGIGVLGLAGLVPWRRENRELRE